MVNRKTAKLTVLLNPSSGRRRAFENKERLEAELNKAGIDYELIVSQSETHLRSLVAEFGPHSGIIAAAGGDSTLTIVAHEMLQNGIETPVAVIPLGSSDDVAREYNIFSLQDGVEALAKGKTRRVDLGYFSTTPDKPSSRQYYCGQANIGIGAEVNRYVAQKAGTWLGGFQTLAGVSGIASAYRNKRASLELVIESEGGVVRGHFTSALFTKIRYWATGKIYAPDARLDSALLHGVFVGRCGLGRLLRITAASVKGNHGRFREVDFAAAPRFRVTSPRPFTIQVDGDIAMEGGEALEFSDVTFGVLKKGLTMVENPK